MTTHDQRTHGRSASSAATPTVVGIGASAGGLAALQAFFERVPAESGIAFVVVVHLSPDHESHLANVLQPHVKMPVLQVTETVSLKANHVYLIPPKANLEAIDSHLRLSSLEERRRERAPVDHFFRTLAQTHDGHAVGIILTGTGSDGALGVKSIKERGGLTIAQSPADAEYDGMPQSAIATGFVDIVLPLSKIPEAVLQLVRTDPHVEVTDDEADLAVEARQRLQNIFAQLRARTGRDFTRYKRSTILRRIARRMQLQYIEDLGVYVDLVRSSADEAQALADDLLITVTSFFRDPTVFEKLEHEILPELFAKKGADDEIRIWSVGCATGEEAYSLAMLLLEEAVRHPEPPRLQIFASDLHEHSLGRARAGLYPADIEVDVGAERLRRFFRREDGGYRVRNEVREMVVFAPHNLMNAPPFSRMDLIACRNLLIYLQREAQRDVVEIFHFALRKDGILLLGTSETVERNDLFVITDKNESIYRKRNVPSPEPRLPVFPFASSLQSAGGARPELGADRPSYGEIHARMVERYAPPSLMINPDDKIVHLSEHAGRFLTHSGGELTASVFKLIREELRIELVAALSAARRGTATRTRPVLVQIDGNARSVVLDVRPAGDAHEQVFTLVLFDERSAADEGAHAAAGAIPAPSTNGGRETELAAELALTRQRIRALIEEYETGQEEMRAANEELQSANEELRSTLEELETSKEELQSVNEELQTVNQENRHKVEELAQLSGDLQNFLASTDIATLFLDRELRIMRFTPRVEELFSVRLADRGRPLSDLSHRLGYDSLRADAQQVLAKLVPIEREIQHDDGRWYLTRVLPYRSTQDRIEGIVLTFVEITQRKKAEEDLRESETLLSGELATMVDLHTLVGRLLVCPDLDSALDEILDATISITNADMGDIQLVDPSSNGLELAVQRGFDADFLERFAAVRLGNGTCFGAALARRDRVIVHDVEIDPSFAACREMATTAGYRGVQSTPLLSRTGDVLGVLTTHYRAPYHPSERDLRILDLYARQATDFIERVRSTNSLRDKTAELEEEDSRKVFFLATLGHELRNPLAALDSSVKLIEEGVRGAAELYPTMSAQIRQLSRLVNDLLEVSRVTRGTLTLRKDAVDLDRVLRDAAEEVASSLQAKRQDLVLPDEIGLLIQADAPRLVQVFSNLLGNAAKYSPDAARIEVTATREGAEAVIAVRDVGRGIALHEIDRIFEPFAQTEPGGGGLGIGLALVRRLVELHGGSVQAASEGAGRGSVFTVRLPIGDVAPAAIDPAPGTRRENLPAGTRVLIVDDSHDNADTLALLLEAYGVQALCAYSGAEGIEKARTWSPQVALVDIGLPDMLGYEVAKRLRAEPGGRRMLLLAVTGFGDPGAAESARLAGFDERMVKPVDHGRLREVIASHMEGREDS